MRAVAAVSRSPSRRTPNAYQRMTAEERRAHRVALALADYRKWLASEVKRVRGYPGPYQALGCPFGDTDAGWAQWVEFVDTLQERDWIDGIHYNASPRHGRPAVALRYYRNQLTSERLAALAFYVDNHPGAFCRSGFRRRAGIPLLFSLMREPAPPTSVEFGYKDHPAADLMAAVQALCFDNPEAVEALSVIAPQALQRVRAEWAKAFDAPCSARSHLDSWKVACAEVDNA